MGVELCFEGIEFGLGFLLFELLDLLFLFLFPNQNRASTPNVTVSARLKSQS